MTLQVWYLGISLHACRSIARCASVTFVHFAVLQHRAELVMITSPAGIHHAQFRFALNYRNRLQEINQILV